MKNKTIQRSINASILKEAKKQLTYGRKNAVELRKNGSGGADIFLDCLCS